MQNIAGDVNNRKVAITLRFACKETGCPTATIGRYEPLSKKSLPIIRISKKKGSII